MIKAETKLLKTILCGMIFGVVATVIIGLIFAIGLYLNIFVIEGYKYLIILFFTFVFIAPILEDFMDVIIQRRKFYIINENSITIGSKSNWNKSEDTFPFKNISIKIRFENMFCYESIELYAFAEKYLIEKSELSNKDYEEIKTVLLNKCKENS